MEDTRHQVPSGPPEELKQRIFSLAASIGFTACGVTTAEPFADYQHALRERMKRFPETAPLYEKMMKRVDPAAANPWARSIVVCIHRYGTYRLPDGLVSHIARHYLADCRYEGHPDHHMKEDMKAGLRNMGLRVRTGGVPDRAAAARAGVTRFGRNCFAYSKHGSWIDINTWLVDAELPPDEPKLDPPCPDNCRACMNACPTGALAEPYVMNMSCCIAYLTYGAPEPIDPALWKRMGSWIYGCDVCQQVCPLNNNKWENTHPSPWLEQAAPRLTPEALSTMSQETYENVVHPLFWYIPADNLERWHRNASRALTDSGR